MKKVFGVLAFLSFFFVFGTVGAMEQDMVGLGAGFFRCLIGLGCMDIFTRLAGGYDYSYTYDEDEYEESRPRCSRPKGGKRKSSV